MIINSDNFKNFSSNFVWLVKLQETTSWAYIIPWYGQDKLTAKVRCLLQFSIGDLLCKQVKHIILGKPWIYIKGVT